MLNSENVLADSAQNPSPFAVQEWVGGRVWVGQVVHLDRSQEWGFLTIFDDDTQTLQDPNGRKVDSVWFRNARLGLQKGEWVVCELEDAWPNKKAEKNNPYLAQVKSGTVRRVRELSGFGKRLREARVWSLQNFQDDYLTDLHVLGERMFIVDDYAREIEANIRDELERGLNNKIAQLEQEHKERVAAYELALETERTRLRLEHEALAEQTKSIQKATEDLNGMRTELDASRSSLLAEQTEWERKRDTERETLEFRRLLLDEEEQQQNGRLARWGLVDLNQPQSNQEFAEFATETELIDRVMEYVAAQGYFFDRHTLANFYTCLKTGALVILAGLSGTGKSSLVRLFARAIDSESRLVSVKATWNDDHDLMGFYHPERQTYYPTPFLDVVVEANRNPERLFFVCFDEMSLSKVEYYLSDLLSVLEQGPERKLQLYSSSQWKARKAQLERQRQACREGKISQAELDHYERNVHCYQHELGLPENIFLCGTVNIDETTHQFSDKVLDRAQVIQFEDAPFAFRHTSNSVVLPVHLDSTQFRSFCVRGQESVDNTWLNELNNHLRQGGFHFGYRVRDHIDDYCAYALQSEVFGQLNLDTLLDLQIIQKVLPKLRGLRDEGTDRMFRALQGFCESRHPRALEKIERMAQMDSINYWQVMRADRNI